MHLKGGVKFSNYNSSLRVYACPRHHHHRPRLSSKLARHHHPLQSQPAGPQSCISYFWQTPSGNRLYDPLTTASGTSPSRTAPLVCRQSPRRWVYLYLALAFTVLISVMSYRMINQGLTKTVLLFVDPCYLLLTWGCFKAFKNSAAK
jgi:hypothetical protein